MKFTGLAFIIAVILVASPTSHANNVISGVNCDIQRKCSLVSQPICAGNRIYSQTFQNNCVYSNYVCLNGLKDQRIKSQGNCPTIGDPNAPQFEIFPEVNCKVARRCSSEEDLICAGPEKCRQTFQNYCLYSNYVCDNNINQNQEVISRGKCPIIGALSPTQ